MRAADEVATWNRVERAAGVALADRSFLLPGTAAAGSVLLLHGAGGSPDDLRELGEILAARGRTALCPLLPGHGRPPEVLADVRFADLVSRALGAFELLRRDGGDVALVAQSLGAALGVHLAARAPITRFAALAPALRPFVVRRLGLLAALTVVRPRLAHATLRWQWELLRGIRQTRDYVPRVTCPLLVLASRDDASVSLRGARELHTRATSGEKAITVLDGQGHVLSRAPDRRRAVFAPVVEFLDRAAAPGRTAHEH